MQKIKLAMMVASVMAALFATAQPNTFPAVGNVGIGTLAPASNLQVIGTSRLGSAANYATFDASGNFSFTGNGNYRVAGNRYAFQFSGNPNYGLFFNSTDVRYEFRNGAAVPVFYVGANDGNAVFTGGVRIGNSVLANAGNLRWTGTDFQGYNGSTWISLSAPLNRWGTLGNSGTNPGINFIGTTDNTGFSIRTNNVERIRVQGDGDMGIGTANPDAKLQIDGGTNASISGGGYIILGSSTGNNIGIDNNEIQARNGSGAGADFFINGEGGNVRLSGTLETNNSTGFVKIGDVSSLAGRDLDITHGTSSGSQYGLRLKNAGTNNEDWTFYTENVSGDLVLYENGIERGRFNDASGTYTASSDRRLKKDIEAAGTVMEKVKSLEVKKYNFIDKPTNHKFYGLIAQDVEKIFPEIVSHNEHDDNTDGYTMDYSAFGVIAIKAIQEQQEKINSQDKKIEELTKLVNQLLQNNAVSSNAITNTKTVASGAVLEQNAPNPFNSVTTIRYNVPSSVNNAQILVINAAGNTVKTFNLSGKGAGNVTINANELTAGNYYYTLIVDGKKADSKKMVLMK